MKKDFELIAGLLVEGEVDIVEGFFVMLNEQTQALSIRANVGASKQVKVFKDLVAHLTDDLRGEIAWRSPEGMKVWEFDFKINQWADEDLDWILQDGFCSLRVGDGADEIFAGPLQVLYVNSRQPGPYKKVLRHWFIRQQTHLQTLYTPAKEGRVVERALKKSGEGLGGFLVKKLGIPKS